MVGRRVDVIGMGRQTKLENSHSGQFVLFYEIVHGRSDLAQVLDDDGATPETVLQFTVEIVFRCSYPFSFCSGFMTCRNLPVCYQCPEVVDPHAIELVQIMSDSIQPPGVTFLFQRRPIIYRIAPELPRFAEAVRRRPGNKGRFLCSVEFEKLRISPYIGALIGNVDWDVADYSNAEFVAVKLQERILPEEYVLEKLMLCDCSFVSRRKRPERFGFAGAEFLWPVVPVARFVEVTHCYEKGIIIQPLFVIFTELLVSRIVRFGEKVSVGDIEQLPFKWNDFRKINFGVIESGDIMNILSFQKTMPVQKLWTDQDRIARKSAPTVIRRVRIAYCRRIDREYLPVTLTGFGKEIGERKRTRPEIPHAVFRRKGCDVHEYSAISFFCHIHFRPAVTLSSLCCFF